jgi:hypothetical protein
VSKGRRGELITPLLVGLAYDAAGHVILDPDTAVRSAVAHLFATFAATGSASACVKAFNAAGMNWVSAANQARSAGSYRTRPAVRRSTAFSCRSTSNSASFTLSPRNTRTTRPNNQRISR